MRKSTKSLEPRMKKDGIVGEPRSHATDGELDGDLLSPQQWIEFAGQFRLSNRELAILVLTSRGMSRKAIPRELKIKLNTLNKLADRLRKKTGAGDRVALVLRVVCFSRACH